MKIREPFNCEQAHTVYMPGKHCCHTTRCYTYCVIFLYLVTVLSQQK